MAELNYPMNYPFDVQGRQVVVVPLVLVTVMSRVWRVNVRVWRVDRVNYEPALVMMIMIGETGKLLA